MPETARAHDLSFLNGAEEPEGDRDYLLDQGDRGWSVNNSTLQDYSRRANILGHPDGLTGIIAAQIGYHESNAGLDLAAGPKGRALRSLLRSGLIHQALATSYEEPPKSWRDPRRLSHISGDLTELATWEQIVGWKEREAPEGFAIVMHRPIGGLQHLQPRTYKAAAHCLLDMVRPGGLMFTQVPRPFVSRHSERYHLDEMCLSIRERADVDEILTSAPRPSHIYRRDETDMYAVILKR